MEISNRLFHLHVGQDFKTRVMLIASEEIASRVGFLTLGCSKLAALYPSLAKTRLLLLYALPRSSWSSHEWSARSATCLGSVTCVIKHCRVLMHHLAFDEIPLSSRDLPGGFKYCFRQQYSTSVACLHEGIGCWVSPCQILLWLVPKNSVCSQIACRLYYEEPAALQRWITASSDLTSAVGCLRGAIWEGLVNVRLTTPLMTPQSSIKLTPQTSFKHRPMSPALPATPTLQEKSFKENIFKGNGFKKNGFKENGLKENGHKEKEITEIGYKKNGFKGDYHWLTCKMQISVAWVKDLSFDATWEGIMISIRPAGMYKSKSVNIQSLLIVQNLLGRWGK